MRRNDIYVEQDGGILSLKELDAEERRLVNRLRRRAQVKAEWDDFDNYCYRVVAEFYDARRASRRKSRDSIPFRIAQDLSGRIAVATGMARLGDYRDELEELIRKQFPSARAFCRATGISPTMLSHVLAGRKDLSLDNLAKALERIGYRLRFVPAAPAKRTG